jgi:hypothetical protein
MKAANPWITYRTRFLVQAKQLTTGLTFTDALGRQHSGCKGDYLVESSDGAFRIAPRQIFEDVYVPLHAGETPQHSGSTTQVSAQSVPEFLRRDQTLPSLPNLRKKGPTRQRDRAAVLPLHLSRKSPQPDRNFPNPGLRSL